MQKSTRRGGVITVIICILTTLILTGCKGPQEVVTIDGYVVTDGVYLVAQLEAYNAIYPDYYGSENFLAETDESGTPVTELIETETMNIIYKLAYANRNFDGAGKTLTEEQQSEFDFNFAYSYPQSADYLSQNGIGEQSYADYSLLLYKFDLLFTELYDNDGEKQPTNDEIAEFFGSTYTPITLIDVPLITAEYTTLAEDVTLEQHEIAQDIVNALEDGDTVEEVIEEYLPKALENASLAEYNAETPEEYYRDDLVSAENTTYSTEQFEQISAGSPGDTGTIENYYATSVYIIEEDDTEMIENDYRASLIYEMFFEEFEAMVFAEAAGYSIDIDSFATSYYSPKKVV